MKKLLMASIILFLFSASVLLIQSSCSKTTAQTPTSISQQNKIIYFRNMLSGTIQICTANYDGTNVTQVPLVLPPNVGYDPYVMTNSLSISPDGQTIFFTCSNSSGPNDVSEIYSCSINGGAATLIASGFSGKVHAY